MGSRQKAKGTRFESSVVRYMREALGDDRIERRALHGTQDMGDIYGIRAHGWDVIAECKSHKEVTPALVAEWREQTLRERENADAGAALLVVSVYRASVARSAVPRADIDPADGERRPHGRGRRGVGGAHARGYMPVDFRRGIERNGIWTRRW